jgi:hypothetical protein
MYAEYEEVVQSLLGGGWVEETTYVLENARWGHWSREIFKKGGDYKAIDVRYHSEEGICDLSEPFTVHPYQVTRYG